jgi:hypothetical protein
VTNLKGPAEWSAAARRLATSDAVPARGLRQGILIEGLLAVAIAIAVGVAIWRFHQIGYLPQPFLYDLNYPLMGLYDTAYWANHPGAYGLGRSIYPPLSFLFLRLATIHSCYAMSPFEGRDCDWLAHWVILGFYVLNTGLVYRSFRKSDPRTALPRAVALCIGLPMLYALECSNVIIVSFTFFVLGYGGLIRSAPLRWLALGLSINFKPYLFVVLAPPLFRRQWRWLIGCVVVGVLIYLLTYAIQGSGSPAQLVENIKLYASDITHQYWSDVYFSTSYWPLVNILSSEVQLLGMTSAQSGEAWRWLLVGVIRLAQLGTLACLVAAAFRPAGMVAHRFAALILATILTTITTGQSGYVQIFLFFLLFFEPFRGPVRITVLVTAYLLSISADYAYLPVIHGPAWSYLGGRSVVAEFGVSVGQLLRPAGLLVIQFALVALNLRDLLGRDRPSALLGPLSAAAVARP